MARWRVIAVMAVVMKPGTTYTEKLLKSVILFAQ